MRFANGAKTFCVVVAWGLSSILLGCGGDQPPPAPPPAPLPVVRPAPLPPKVEPQPSAEELAKKQAEIESAAGRTLRDFGAAVQVNEAGLVVYVNLLNHPRCNDEALEPLKSLKNVVALDLRGTKISDEALSIISGLGALEELYLGNTTVTDAGLAKLKPLSQLKVLNLVGTQVSDAGVIE